MFDEMSWEEAVALAKGKDQTDRSLALFHWVSKEDEEASEETGKKIFKDVPYIMIMAPGNDKEVIDRQVLEKDKERFPKEWYRFINQEKPEVEGFPIEEWPQVSKSQADTLKANHILSVENLAQAPDQNLMGLGMGMMSLKSKATTWLDLQSGEVNTQKLANNNRKLGKENAALKRQVEDLEKRLAGLENILAKTEDSTEELPA